MASGLQLGKEATNLESLRADVARFAVDACFAAEQAAVDAIDAALAQMATKSADHGSGIRAIAEGMVAHAQLLQGELDRYLTVATAEN